MAEVVLVRHGLAWCNLNGLIGGANGCRGLAIEGRNQIRRLSGRLLAEQEIGLKVTAIVASPRRRTVESAHLLAGPLDLPVRIDSHFADQNLGPLLDGTKWTDLRRSLRLAPGEFPSVKVHPDAETWQEHLDRVARGLRLLSQRSFEGRVIVVAHTETAVGAFHSLAKESPPPSPVTMRHAAMTVWRLASGKWYLKRHDDVQHLEK